ncbi:MAG: DegT/DnrJ/EryC1/StrS family aminotransferase [Halobacteriota archaeon]|jgi:dTDP-4-amino-4,6-dideoxygalactose transaminase
MSQNTKIPFVDLVTPHQELQEELVNVFKSALATAGFVGGPMVDGFEREFATYCGAKHCVGVNSGTDALRFALTAAGVNPGDVVLTVPHTFIATAEAISQAGARPDFVDIDAHTYTMDPEMLRQYLQTQCAFDPATGRFVHRTLGKPVTAVVPVHLYGQMADMDAILELAGRYNLAVIEDACQAHGAEYFSKKENRWRKAGSMGHAAAFSFYPGKNLGACGEGGAVITDDETIARKAKMLRDHGQSRKYYHDIEGYNGRLDSIQAGFLRVKLKHLPDWNESRREHARKYNELFAAAATSAITPFEAPWSKAVYHLYILQVENREAVQADLAKENIDTGIHYPVPLHLQKAYSSLGYKQGAFPVCEKVAEHILSLPMFPGLSEADQERVVHAVVQSAQCAGPQSVLRA